MSTVERVEDLSDEEIAAARFALDVVASAKTLTKATGDTMLRLSGRLRDEVAARAASVVVFRMSLPLEVEIKLPPPKRAPKPGAKPKKDTLKLKLAMSLNEYCGAEPWALVKVRDELDRRIELAKGLCPAWDCGSDRKTELVKVTRGETTKRMPKLTVTGGRRRLVQVIRHSSRQVDEPAVDILGGKMVLDRLVWAGVIAGDSGKKVMRRGRWIPCLPGDGRLDVIVYELPGEA